MLPTDQTVTAWRHALEALLNLGDQLSEVDWNRPTDCPGWSVQDIYAHLIGGERWMAAGHPSPDDGFGRWAEEPVAARRGRPPAAVLAELAEMYRLRTAQVAEQPPDPDAPAYSVVGAPVSLAVLWATRAFDAWVHEQDVRLAVRRPGNLAAPGALVSRDLFLASLPRIVAKAAGAGPRRVVRVTVVGEVGFDAAVEVGADGRGARIDPAEAGRPAAHLTLGWAEYARLSCGRRERSTVDAWISGDDALAEAVLARLVITP